MNADELSFALVYETHAMRLHHLLNWRRREARGVSKSVKTSTNSGPINHWNADQDQDFKRL